MIKKKDCTGCGACFNACIKGAIKMERFKDGFYYPQIDKEKCNGCGFCEKVCPIEKEKTLLQISEAYAAKINDDEIKIKSSSGGVFSAIANAVLTENGVVFGAAFDEDFNVIHKSISKTSDLEQIRRSKYTQSDTVKTFTQVKELLKYKKVLFAGTPCQIAGLKSYLQKDYENLITVDVICHGVPSPTLWQKYKKHLEEKATSKIITVNFRNKKNGWKVYSMAVKFEDNTEQIKPITQDLYMLAFLSNYFLRKSCYNCAFKNQNYKSDITLADFWGIDKVMPQINDDTGVSLVIINTEKGKKLYKAVSNEMQSYQIDKKQALNGNPSYYSSVGYSMLQKYATQDSCKMDFNKLYDKYCGKSLKSKIIRKTNKFLTRIFKL